MSRNFPDRIAAAVAVALFLLLAGLTRAQTPLFETPDETSHFSVVQYLARARRLPPPPIAPLTGPAPLVTDNPPNYYAPPLYHALAALLILDLDTSGYSDAVIPNPYFALGWGLSLGNDLTSKHMYVHTAEQQPPAQAGWAQAMERVRHFSLLLGALTVLAAVRLTGLLWPGAAQRGWRWAAVALVALNPTFIFTHTGVSNDPLLIALSAWTVTLCAGLLVASGDDGLSRRSLTGQGLLLLLLVSAAALTKQSGVLLAAPVIYTWVTVTRRQSWSRGRIAAGLLLGALLGLLLAGWWYGLNGLRYGDPLGLGPHAPLAAPGDPAQRLHFLLGQLGGVFHSYWAALGWATIFPPLPWSVAFALLTAIGVGGWLRRPARAAWPAALPGLLWLVLALNLLLLVAWLWRTAAPYGRLLFPALLPASCILIEGWRRLLAPAGTGRERAAIAFQGTVIAGLLLLALWLPLRHARPAFASPLIASQATADDDADPGTPDLGAPAFTVYGDEAALLGYRVAPDLRAGERADLTLYWRRVSPDPTPADLMVIVQAAALDPEQWVADRTEFLGTGRYPTTVWRLGDVIGQRLSLELPEDAAAPALYWFNVGVRPGADGERLPVTAGLTPTAGNLVRLGPVRLLPPRTAAAAPENATDYRLGTGIRLAGYDAAFDAAAGRLAVTLHWQAVGEIEGEWTVFAQLTDAGGTLLAQDDAPPADGNYPTSWWREGDRIPDRHEFQLPGGVAPEELFVLVGLYNPLTGARLEVRAAETGEPQPDGIIRLPVGR